ncbi:MAG TPA: POTRA domain-containing protein [Gemmatimonadales bacterium]|nr:POTRA domain-containing protein [Gemmatimonadales bacterium]
MTGFRFSRWHLLPLVMLLVPFRLAAQVPADSAGADRPSHGDTLRGIELDRRDIFDPDERGWIARVANALHIQTRAATIRRELLFQPGEPYDSARVAESERNLRALGVFRRVRIDTLRTDSGLVARVLTKDGWSTKADWRFRSTGGEVAYTIGLVEDNLLGTASSAAVRYRKTPDRTSVTLGLRRPRLFAGKVGVGALYENRSDGRITQLAVEQPFYSLTSRFGIRVEGEDRDERVLQFFNGSNVARDTLTHLFTVARVSAAWATQASMAGFLRWGLQAQLRREDFRPESSPDPLSKTVTGAFGPYLTWSRANFLVARGVSGFAREEDVDLGLTVRVGLLAAPKAFGYDRDGIGPNLAARAGARMPGGFGYLEALLSGLYDSAGLDSGTVQIAGTAVLQPGPHQVGIFHLEGGWLKDPPPGLEFDLGLGLGPRAFRSHAFTGDRSYFATAEYRYTIVDDFLGQLGLGVAGFVDHGGAWYAGQPSRSGWDAGIGLRIGASRSTDTEALRFDLARRFANDAQKAGWVVTVGKGFVFSPVGRRPL